ncbi:MAG: YkgJ family cysteine cluster protein [Proteobacteria bacterium]|nr:YkgJ family cysteine cluster protein [Pseudomonadota bacterium]
MNGLRQKLELLNVIETVFDRFVSDNYQTACQKGCAACCTHDVTATTLEAHRLLARLKEPGREDLWDRIAAAAAADLFRPRMTTNLLAMFCMNREEPPDEAPGPNPGPCPLLVDETCAAYEDRPLGCRGMFSLIRCQPGREAELPPELATVATTCWQIVEHLDGGGLYGNLTDLLLALRDEKNAFQYETRDQLVLQGLPPTRPVPGFLIPPEQMEPVGAFIEQLLNTDCGGQTFRQRMAEVRPSRF